MRPVPDERGAVGRWPVVELASNGREALADPARRAVSSATLGVWSGLGVGAVLALGEGVER